MKHLFIILIVLYTSTSYTQTVSGFVIDSSNNPISYVNILLLNPSDSTLVKGTVSNELGKFKLTEIKKGKYDLYMSLLGYKAVDRALVVGDEPVQLGNIIMEEEAEELSEVVVEARKPMFEQKTDRLVVNVKNSITSAGGTALEVLERSPGIIVNRGQNTLSMNGKDGVLIMINGKLSRQPLPAVMQMLDGMNSQNIESIELISNPPAKYEAAGNAGIIDIRMAQQEDLGMNGSASLTAGYGRNDKEGATLNLNYRKNKINLYTDLSFYRDHGDEIWVNDRIINNIDETLTSQTITDRDPISLNFNGKLGMDYQLTEKVVIGTFISGYFNEWDMEASNVGFQRSSVNPAVNFTSNNTELNRWSNVSGNLNILYNLTQKSKLNFDIDYLYYNNENPTSYRNDFFDESNSLTSSQVIQATKDTPIDIWVGRVDYENQLNEKMKLEFGAKGTFSSLDNNVDIQELINNQLVRDEELSEFSDLKEQILGVYGTLNYSINEKTDLNLGLRYERTSTDLTSLSEGQVLDLNYDNLFPTIFLSRTLSEQSKLIFSYGRRITRPAYNDLAPFVIFLDPNTFFFGNTALQPSISDNLELNYQVKKTIVSFKYGHESDAIVTYQPIVLENGNQVFTSLNLDYRDTYTLSLSQRYTFFKWWDGNINVQGIRLVANPIDNEKTNANYIGLNGSQTFKFGGNWSFELSGWLQTERKDGLSSLSNIGNITLGLQKKFSNDSRLSLTVNNLFGFEYDVFTTEGLDVNYFTNTNYSYEPRIFKLTYFFIFGNKKLKGKRNRNTGAENIKSRVN
ncbi:TonB-dependent receptor domain-containing protein [Croceitalea marina]|uniref:TonB-dependent receptor domain-containing protein n=1 Tax=Croceitalea marina TaxID=1775166 RepID=A0ABW5MYF3_9FLAO